MILFLCQKNYKLKNKCSCSLNPKVFGHFETDQKCGAHTMEPKSLMMRRMGELVVIFATKCIMNYPPNLLHAYVFCTSSKVCQI